MGGAALLGRTKRTILGSLVWSDRTAADLARQVGVNTAAARRHLEAMETQGLVRSYFLRGGVGRPKKLYALGEEGREVLGKRYDLFLNQLLDHIVRREGKVRARELLRSMARDIARQARNRIGRKRGEERLRALVEVYNEMGFPTALERREGRWAIIKRDCIVYKAAREHQDLVCDFDNEIIRASLGDVDVDLQECLGKGNNFCRQVLLPHRGAHRNP